MGARQVLIFHDSLSIGKEAPRFLSKKSALRSWRNRLPLVPGIGTDGQTPKKEVRLKESKVFHNRWYNTHCRTFSSLFLLSSYDSGKHFLLLKCIIALTSRKQSLWTLLLSVSDHLPIFYAGVSSVGTFSFTYHLHIVSSSILDHLVFLILFSSHTFKRHLYAQCPTMYLMPRSLYWSADHKSKGTLSISTWMFCRNSAFFKVE